LNQLQQQHLIDGKTERSLSMKIMKTIDDSIKSGIYLELILYTKVPIKGHYGLTYKVDYGRFNSKWTEVISHEVNKS
jgi:hypothetical protein